MTTDQILFMLGAFVLGGILGVFYFGALWFTVRRIPHARHPGLLTLGSFLIRLAVTLAGFYLVVWGGHWERLLSCLLGFVLARVVLVSRWRPHASWRSDTF
jgi:F1F0 ATPase subunit 2